MVDNDFCLVFFVLNHLLDLIQEPQIKYLFNENKISREAFFQGTDNIRRKLIFNSFFYHFFDSF